MILATWIFFDILMLDQLHFLAHFGLENHWEKVSFRKKKPLGKVFFRLGNECISSSSVIFFHFALVMRARCGPFLMVKLPLVAAIASVKVRFLHAICNCFSFSLWWSENSKKFGFCTTFFQVISSLWWITTLKKNTARWRFLVFLKRMYSTLAFFSNLTVFENHRKSLNQHCKRSELRLHFERTKKSSLKMAKMVQFSEFLKT